MKLELKYLAPYLPYGLKISTDDVGEDWIEIAKIFNIGHLIGATKDLIRNILKSLEHGSKITCTGVILNWMQVVDFLRSKGYVLPWMGLSVEQLVEFGWIKLKTP